MLQAYRAVLIPLAILAFAALCPAAPAASAPAKAPAPAKATLPGDLDEMAKVCHLVNDQKEKLAEMARERQRTLQEWDKANGPRLAAARQGLASAVTAHKADQVKIFRDEVDMLEKERADTVAKIDHDIMGVLTTQQRTDWDAYRLDRDLLEKFQSLGLTDDQLKKTQKICSDVASLPVPAFVDAEAEAKAGKDAFDKAFNLVYTTVLTQDQRDAFQGNAPPDKGEKPAKPDPKSKAPPKKTR